MSRRRLFALIDERGVPVEAAGPAPFDGRTRVEAAREALATAGPMSPGWRLVPLTSRLERALTRMAKRVGLLP